MVTDVIQRQNNITQTYEDETSPKAFKDVETQSSSMNPNDETQNKGTCLFGQVVEDNKSKPKNTVRAKSKSVRRKMVVKESTQKNVKKLAHRHINQTLDRYPFLKNRCHPSKRIIQFTPPRDISPRNRRHVQSPRSPHLRMQDDIKELSDDNRASSECSLVVPSRETRLTSPQKVRESSSERCLSDTDLIPRLVKKTHKKTGEVQARALVPPRCNGQETKKEPKGITEEQVALMTKIILQTMDAGDQASNLECLDGVKRRIEEMENQDAKLEQELEL